MLNLRYTCKRNRGLGRRNTSRGSLLAVWPVADPWKPRASASASVGAVLAPRQCAADRGERLMSTASIGPLCQLGAATSPRFPGNAPSLASTGYSMPDSIAKLPKAGQRLPGVTGQRRGSGQQAINSNTAGQTTRRAAQCSRLGSAAIQQAGQFAAIWAGGAMRTAQSSRASAWPALALALLSGHGKPLAGQGPEGLISHKIPYANRIDRHRQGMRAHAGAFRAVYGTRATPPTPTHPPPGSTASPIVPPTPTTLKIFVALLDTPVALL